MQLIDIVAISSRILIDSEQEQPMVDVAIVESSRNYRTYIDDGPCSHPKDPTNFAAHVTRPTAHSI